MAEYRLLVKASAAREIEALGTKADRQRVIERIQALSADPRAQGSEKLAGVVDRYRVRQGPYRIVYLIDDRRHEITIFKIGHRKDVPKTAADPDQKKADRMMEALLKMKKLDIAELERAYNKG